MRTYFTYEGLVRLIGRVKRDIEASKLASSIIFPQGQNDALDPVSEKFVASANRLAFLPPEQVILLTTIDGGASWTEPPYTLLEERKRAVFSQQRSYSAQIPLKNGKQDTQCGMQIYFTCRKYNVPTQHERYKYQYWNTNAVLERYMGLKHIFLWTSTTGNRMSIKVEGAKYSSPSAWTTLFDSADTPAFSWPAGYLITLGNEIRSNAYDNIRITCFTIPNRNGVLTDTSNPQVIYEVQGFGRSVYTSANPFMNSGHLYSWDEFQNAKFPAQVAARGSIKIGNTTLTEAQLQQLLTKL